jgi:hypothetical protein
VGGVGSGAGAVIVTGGASLAAEDWGASGWPLTSLLIGTVTLSLMVFGALACGAECASEAETGVCGGVGSAFEVIGGFLSVSIFDGAVMLLRRA